MVLIIYNLIYNFVKIIPSNFREVPFQYINVQLICSAPRTGQSTRPKICFFCRTGMDLPFLVLNFLCELTKDENELVGRVKITCLMGRDKTIRYLYRISAKTIPFCDIYLFIFY